LHLHQCLLSLHVSKTLQTNAASCLLHTYSKLHPAGLLNLFWGVLVFKKKAEKALEASGIPYVIIRPGGMERPTDSYKRTHNVRLATRDKLFGGQVSRLQVAELIAATVTYPDAAQNKVRLGPAPPSTLRH